MKKIACCAIIKVNDMVRAFEDLIKNFKPVNQKDNVGYGIDAKQEKYETFLGLKMDTIQRRLNKITTAIQKILVKGVSLSRIEMDAIRPCISFCWINI